MQLSCPLVPCDNLTGHVRITLARALLWIQPSCLWRSKSDVLTFYSILLLLDVWCPQSAMLWLIFIGNYMRTLVICSWEGVGRTNAPERLEKREAGEALSLEFLRLVQPVLYSRAGRAPASRGHIKCHTIRYKRCESKCCKVRSMQTKRARVS
jgi:hypothetical protein